MEWRAVRSGIFLPIIAIFYTAATLHSAVQYWLGHGGEWKGRLQDAKSDSAS